MIRLNAVYVFSSGCGEAWYRAWFGSKRPWVQIPPLGPPGTLEAVRPQGFSAFLGASFPLCFPLPAGNALDELLHPGGAGLLHLVGDVAVDIQGKGGGGVAHVALDGLDVIAAPDGGHSVGVA